MIKIKNHHILNIGMLNNLYGWAMSQKLPVNNFEEIEEDTSQFNENCIKNMTKKVMKDILLKLMFSTLKNCMNS